MKIRLALLICALAVMLTACGCWIVEEEPVQVGHAVVRQMEESVSPSNP